MTLPRHQRSSSSSSSSSATEDPFLLRKVAKELQILRLDEKSSAHSSLCSDVGAAFPRSCQRLLRQIPGNHRCVDCGSRNPDWASLSFGVLMCTNCAGTHRSYGVQTSRVRSISMDSWSHAQVLTMLEGGNDQLTRFFGRHEITPHNNNTRVYAQRYQTRAAKFYRHHMQRHAQGLAGAEGPWKGRQASRRKQQQQQPHSAPVTPVSAVKPTVRRRSSLAAMRPMVAVVAAS